MNGGGWVGVCMQEEEGLEESMPEGKQRKKGNGSMKDAFTSGAASYLKDPSLAL